MQVRMLIGPNANRIVDIVYDRAKALVEAGQAEDVYDQMRLAKPVSQRVEATTVAAATEAPEPVMAEVAPVAAKPKLKKGSK